MEAFESSQGVVTHPGPRDKYPRYTKTARVEIDCRMPDTLVDGGHLLPMGKSVVTIPGRSLQAVLDLAWDKEEADRVKRAEKRRDSLIEAELREEFNPEMNVPEFRKEIARVKAMHPDERNDREADLINALRESHTKTRHSTESCFFEEHHRGINPFKSVKVLGKDLPLPEEEDKVMHDKAQLGALVELLKGASSGSDEVAALKAELAEMRAEMAALVEAATAPNKSGKSKG